MMRRIVAVVVALALGLSMLPGQLIAQGVTGSLGGHSRYQDPNYEVRIQNVDTGQILGMAKLDSDGNFLVGNLLLPGNFLIVLYDLDDMEPVCTEGPFMLSPENAGSAAKLDVEIRCGRTPAALLLGILAGGLGLATAFAIQSDIE